MSEKAHEIEALVLAMFAALPLYVTQTISPLPLLAFHAVMLAMTIRVAMGNSPEIIPLKVMRVLGAGYVVFYIVDAVAISRSAIAASTHLVLFIAAYQPVEGKTAKNYAQRLLTAALIFTASIATATSVAILPFIVIFGFLLLRQLMHLTHVETLAVAGRAIDEPPSTRPAMFYVCGTAVIGVMLFPILPRVRNPLVPGMAGSLSNASTGLSETIDFNQARTISPDSSVVSRIWMGQEAVPFFTPLRLRGAVYDRFSANRWFQGLRTLTPLDTHDNVVRIAKPSGFTRHATVQQRMILQSRLFLPVGTYEIDGIPSVAEAPRESYIVWGSRSDIVSYGVQMAREITPLRARRVAVTNYPVTPQVAAMARKLVGNHTDPMEQARDIERYMSTRFRYVSDPAQVGHTMSVDQFLLRDRTGHCEYFAAGMVALMTALNVPARIVGGFYGGKLNPLTGYFVVRREDAHAWVEVFDGSKWQTFDPTPASLRPGNTQAGLIRVYASAIGDSINYFWDRYILTFGVIDQIALAANALDRAREAMASLRHGTRASLAQLATLRFAVFVLLVVLAGMLVLFIAWRRRPAFEMLREHLARLGIEVGPAMTMEEALGELRRTRAEDAARLAPLIELYETERFSARSSRELREALRRRLSELDRPARPAA